MQGTGWKRTLRSFGQSHSQAWIGIDLWMARQTTRRGWEPYRSRSNMASSAEPQGCWQTIPPSCRLPLTSSNRSKTSILRAIQPRPLGRLLDHSLLPCLPTRPSYRPWVPSSETRLQGSLGGPITSFPSPSNDPWSWRWSIPWWDSYSKALHQVNRCSVLPG